ncbi:MAG: sulfur carrier protein ThiS [Phycisphaerales bacterium]|jgi:thiamine biosynthesis protein ThiS
MNYVQKGRTFPVKRIAGLTAGKGVVFHANAVLIQRVNFTMEMLRINGVEKQFHAGMPRTLAELLEQLNINQATVAAEIDGKIIQRQNFEETQLSSGLSIELVRFVGGG